MNLSSFKKSEVEFTGLLSSQYLLNFFYNALTTMEIINKNVFMQYNIYLMSPDHNLIFAAMYLEWIVKAIEK